MKRNKIISFFAAMACAITMSGCTNLMENLKIADTPIFSVESGVVSPDTEVTLSCATENSVIYYTTNGTKPTKNSTKYTGPIKITEDVKIRAFATEEDMNDSYGATANYKVFTTKTSYANGNVNVSYSPASPKPSKVTITVTDKDGNAVSGYSVDNGVITGLTSGTEYYVTVTAEYSSGNASASVKKLIKTVDAPTDVTTKYDNGKIVVNWTNPANPLSKVIITYTDESGNEQTETITDAATIATGKYELSGVTAGKKYTISIQSEDSNGNKSLPETLECTTVAAPSDITASYDDNKITVKWTNPTSTLSEVTITYKEEGGTEQTFTISDATQISTGKYEIPGITEGKTYTISVKGKDSAGNTSTAQTTECTAVAAPSDVTASYDATSKKVTVKWTNPTTTPYGLIVTYTDENGKAVIKYIYDSKTIKSGKYEIKGLTQNKTYNISVKCIDKDENESAEKSVDCTIVPALGGVSTSYDSTNKKITVKWTNPTSTTTSKVVIVYKDGDGNETTKEITDATTIGSGEYNIPGITESGDYNITIKTYDSDGNQTAEGITNTNVTVANNPGTSNAPSNVTTTYDSTNKKITVNWTNPTSSTPDKIVITYKEEGGTETTKEITNATEIASGKYDIPGVTEGKSYEITVKSVKDGVESTGTTTKCTAVPALGGVSTSYDSTNKKISVNWTNPTSGTPAKVVIVYKDGNGNEQTKTIEDAATIGSGKYDIPGITASGNYDITIKTYDSTGKQTAEGKTTANVDVSGNQGSSNVPANAPSNVTSTYDSTNKKITVNWTNPTSGTPDKIVITYKEEGGTETTKEITNATEIASGKYEIPGVTESTTYDITVKAVKGGTESTGSTTKCATIPALSGVTAKYDQTNGKITLKWPTTGSSCLVVTYTDKDGKTQTKTLTGTDFTGGTCTLDGFPTTANGKCELTIKATDKDGKETGGQVITVETGWECDDTYHWHKCTGCDAEKEAHVFTSGTVTKAATETENGVMNYTCACGKTVNCPIAKIPTVTFSKTADSNGKYKDDVTVTFDGGETGCTYYYTTDGSDPYTSATKVTGTSVTISKSCWLKVVAEKQGYHVSPPKSIEISIYGNVPEYAFEVYVIDSNNNSSLIFRAESDDVVQKARTAISLCDEKTATITDLDSDWFVSTVKIGNKVGFYHMDLGSSDDQRVDGDLWVGPANQISIATDSTSIVPGCSISFDSNSNKYSVLDGNYYFGIESPLNYDNLNAVLFNCGSKGIIKISAGTKKFCCKSYYEGEKKTDYTFSVTKKYVATYQFTTTPVLLTDYTGTDGTTSNYYKFGDFPQSLAASTVDFNPDPETEGDGAGYYVGSDLNYYEKVSNTRYYKVEPIKWRACTLPYTYNSTGDTATLLVAENVLSEVAYYTYESTTSTRNIGGKTIYPNNYEYSQIRAYLNGLKYYNDSNAVVDTYNDKGFLQRAFTSTARDSIKTTKVDNGAASVTCNGYNGESYSKIDEKSEYLCTDTNDKIFLLSVYEARSYISDAVDMAAQSCDKRKRVPTEYSGVSVSYSTMMLRSPLFNAVCKANIYYDGSMGNSYDSGRIWNSSTLKGYGGIVPALVYDLGQK